MEKDIQLLCGDCLELMKGIPDGSIDMILCDLPYGTTACKWDTVIPFEPLWEQYKRIIKDSGVIVLFGSEPFSSALRLSNMGMFRYDWIWKKPKGSGFLSAKKLPLKNHETISVFYLDKAEVTGRSKKFSALRDWFYEERKKTGLSSSEMKLLLGNNMANHYFTKGIQFTIPTEENYKKLQSTGCFTKPYVEIRREFDSIATDCSITYNPQMTSAKPYKCKQGRVGEYLGGCDEEIITVNNGERYPVTILEANIEVGLHPTQKPVALLEYLVNTYTNEGDIVLDNCMGSGSTGVACINTNRKFIGMELDRQYFDIAVKRIEEANERKDKNERL